MKQLHASDHETGVYKWNCQSFHKVYVGQTIRVPCAGHKKTCAQNKIESVLGEISYRQKPYLTWKI